MAFSIFRPLNKDEKKEMIELGETDVLDLFLKELSLKKLFYQKQYRPFDYYCARVDFDNALAQKVEELKTIVDKSKINPTLEFGDLDKYADVGRFEYLGRREAMETKLVAGIKQEVKLGYTYNFKGKLKGNKISVYVPNEDEKIMEAFLDKNFRESKQTFEKQGKVGNE